MGKAVFALIVLHSSGTYAQYEGLTLEHCVAKLMVERKALVEVQKIHPNIKMEFRCEERN